MRVQLGSCWPGGQLGFELLGGVWESSAPAVSRALVERGAVLSCLIFLWSPSLREAQGGAGQGCCGFSWDQKFLWGEAGGWAKVTVWAERFCLLGLRFAMAELTWPSLPL